MARDKILEIAEETTIILMNINSKREFKKMLDDPIMGWKVNKFLNIVYEAILKGRNIKNKTSDKNVQSWKKIKTHSK